jgi:hypothetical protein
MVWRASPAHEMKSVGRVHPTISQGSFQNVREEIPANSLQG